jgi:D-sedoheptulose 7-phosphate isomerase
MADSVRQYPRTEVTAFTQVTAPAEVTAAFERRVGPARDLVDHAAAVADAAYAMAVRFAGGGKLIVFGVGGASTDAQHVAVEFVHPVIVGKRALPAISLTSDVATITALAARDGLASVFAHQIRQLGEADDIALGISADGHCPSVLAGLRAARDIGMLTIALAGNAHGSASQPGAGQPGAGYAVDHLLAVVSADPRIVKEIQVTTYHLLWELVHVFFEQPGILGPGVFA